VALSGGLTPRALYQLLGSAEYGERIDWRVFIFGTMNAACRRSTPRAIFPSPRKLDFQDSNAAENIHRMEGEKEPCGRDAYEQELQQFFAPGWGQLPRFDCIL
jgi:hypothetical protein